MKRYDHKVYAKAQLFRAFCQSCGVGTAHDNYGCINCDLLNEVKSTNGPNSGPIPVRLGNGESEGQ